MQDPKISAPKLAELQRRLDALHIDEKDLSESFIKGSGKGGQKRNKTSNAVYLKHLPTGIDVKVGKNRSLEINRFLARRELCDKLDKLLHNTPTKSDLKAEKIRKQKKRRKRKSQQKADSAQSHG